MKKLILWSAPLALICFQLTAFAQEYRRAVTCGTESNGEQFQKTERDPDLARRLVSNECTVNMRTNNEECRANLWCDNEGAYGPKMITCQTESNGLNFPHASRDESLARRLALSACTLNSRTNNEECRANMVCDNEFRFRQIISCQTGSNGLNFVHEERDAALAQRLAISECTTNSQTNNNECQANVWCNDRPEPVRIDCDTFSNGMSFKHSGLSETLVQSLTLSACTVNPRTNNQECRANIVCRPERDEPYDRYESRGRGAPVDRRERPVDRRERPVDRHERPRQ